jgi:peptidoglycan/LPS O-acetylase OafA/YrhL
MDKQSISKRNYRFDLLKAAAIIGVVFYHSGNLTYGYLGVEVFLVIAGYFLMKNYLSQKDNESFRFVPFLANRILRLWPLILIVCILCLLVGYFTMLPDDYENLGESIVASTVFGNNILAAITTKDYWNIGNNYQPLMHLWYVGVLVQCYIVLLAFFRLCDKFGRKVLKWAVVITLILSLVLFLMPSFSAGDKFYYIPFRLFELLSGSILCFVRSEKSILRKQADIFFGIFFILICVVMIFGTPFATNVSLIIEILLTTAAVYVADNFDETDNAGLIVVSKIGVASFSIYVIHQPIMAFTRYFYTAELKGVVLAIDLLLTAGMSALFYFVFEKGIGSIIKKKGWLKSTIVCIISSTVLIGLGVLVYINAGVVRDVPELDVYKATAYRGMHAEYVDVPYSWNRDFTTDKIHILVVGDSMARDWCNILNESDISNNLEISYVYTTQFNQEYADRTDDADYIFYASIGDTSKKIPEALKPYSQNSNFYVVGIKNFGESNGQIYQKRNQSVYFESTIIMGETNAIPGMTFEEQNERQKEYWGSHYIDMIEPIRNNNGSIPVFTDTNKFISADTEHLTKNGAIYYAKMLDLSFIQ